jgi:hypothetical protein
MLNEVTRIIEVLDSNLGLKSAEEIVKQIITEEENLGKLWNETGFDIEKLGELLGKFLKAKQQSADEPKEPQETSIQPSGIESTEQQPEGNFKHFIKTVATSKLEQGLNEIIQELGKIEDKTEEFIGKTLEVMRRVATFQREIHKSFNKMFSEIAQSIAKQSEGLKDLAELRQAIDEDTLEELDKEIVKIEKNALKIEKIFSEVEKIAGKGVAVNLKQKIRGPIGALLRFFVVIEGLGRFGRATTEEDKTAWEKIAPETGPLKWAKMDWDLKGKIVIKKGKSIRVSDLKLIPYILKFLWQPRKGSAKEIIKLLVDLKKEIDTVKTIIEFLNLEMEATLVLIGELNNEVVEETTLIQTRKSLISALTKGDNINEAITKYIIDTLVQKKQSGIAIQEYSPEEIKLIAESVGQKIAELMAKAKKFGETLVGEVIEIIKEKYKKILGIEHKVELLKAKAERIHRYIYNLYDTIIFEITPTIHEIARIVEESLDKAIEEAEKDMESSK